MNKIQQQACIAFLEGMAEEIRNFDITPASDPVEFIRHLQSMVNIVSEESSGCHLYDEPDDDVVEAPIMPDDYMSSKEALKLLEKAHEALVEGGWTAFMFAALTEKQEGRFVPVPKYSVCVMEENPMCQAEVTSMMTIAAQDNPALRTFIKALGRAGKEAKSFVSKQTRKK